MIDADDKLSELVRWIESAPWIALDTEADSLHAYPEKLCLLQLSLPGKDVILDPLGRVNLAPLFESLKDRELILHGADYDLRLLWRSFRFRPRAIFDTMWAARLLGYPEFSLTHLVGQVLGIPLEKGSQKTNWARRPLSERMERYARNDTRYLQPLSETLSRELESLGRLSWQTEVCARAVEECSQDRAQDPDLVWRVKGSDRLDRRGQAVLRELWHWREREARRRNKPPYFVLSHERLVALAAAASNGESTRAHLSVSLPPGLRADLIEACERGLSVPASEYPKPRRSAGLRLTKSGQSRFERLRQSRDRHASRLKFDPTLIASKATLVSLASNWDRCETELMAWQRELLKDAI